MRKSDVDSNESEHRESVVSTSTVQNHDNNIGSNSSSSYAQPQTEPPAVELEEELEKPDEPTSEEVKEVCIQLRRLSPDVSINPQVKSAIRSFWHNVPGGWLELKMQFPRGGASNLLACSSKHSKMVHQETRR